MDKHATSQVHRPRFSHAISNTMSKIDVGKNPKLGGKLPSELGQLSLLEYLWADDTSISGTIPATYGRLSSLMSLYLPNCRLSSTIPSELGNLSFLRHIVLSDNSFTGPFPSYPGLKRINFLDLNGNNFASLPSELGTFHDLEHFSCSGCGLGGSLPTELSGKTEYTLSCLQSKLDASNLDNCDVWLNLRTGKAHPFRPEPEQPDWAVASSIRCKGIVDVTQTVRQ